MMTGSLVASLSVAIILSMVAAAPSLAAATAAGHHATAPIRLPAPAYTGKFSLEGALRSRRSVRDFSRQPLTLSEVAQLLWAGQGRTDPGGKRTAPSAGALYPLELYLVSGDVSALAKGVHKYHPLGHSLSRVADGDQRSALAAAALGQDWMNAGATVIAVTHIRKKII